ncbi:hypothetical protein CEP53_000590 [Fusarium sp. AF-6]|nr:hypothetical protein CEP53_000590 [Fusarium sp. AF-6]
MATVSDYLLSFLDSLPIDCDETDLQNIWSGLVFPLVLTDDFTANWVAISDPNGSFKTPSGERCRVEPKPHHIDRLQLLAQGEITSTAQRAVYEAIIFGKVAYRLSIGQHREEHPQPARRRFVDLVETKFPVRWRDLIIQYDIYDYNEKKSSQRSPSEAQVYSCLAHPKNIRLLTLLPSTKVSAPIQCSLHEVDHQSNPSYEALSYVWGTSPSRCSILLNGGEFSVGENLGAALRQLRPRDGQGRTFWIDAICINQNNLKEKAHQVAQMDSIYRNASGVVVWLGHESNTSSEVFDACEALQKYNDEDSLSLRFIHSIFHLGCARCSNCGKDMLLDALSNEHDIPQKLVNDYARILSSQVFDSLETREIFARMAKAIEKLLSRPWWTRVWVLQEAILAKKITLHCGQRRVDWIYFRAIIFLTMTMVSRHAAKSSGNPRNQIQNAGTQSTFLALAQRTYVFFFTQRTSGFTQLITKLSLADLLSLTSEFAATDPRDRLFALMSLLPNESSERLALQPDYVVKTRRLYIRAAKHFLETTRSLEVITARPLPGNHDNLSPGDAPLPSWVPNWEAHCSWWLNSTWINDFTPMKALDMLSSANNDKDLTKSDPTEPEEKMQHFRASLFDVSPFAFEFSTWDEILGVRGQSVDTVEEIGPTWDLGSAMEESSVFQAWKSIALMHQETTYPFSNQSRPEVFWRTVLMDRHHSPPAGQCDPYNVERIPSVLDPQNVAKMFKPWGIRCSFPPTTQHEELLFLNHMHNLAAQLWIWKGNLYCAALRLFRTKKGYIGLCHPRARPGDEVAILFGAPVPIVLREFNEGYVHGIMDGEIIQDLRDQGKGMDETDYKLFKLI